MLRGARCAEHDETFCENSLELESTRAFVQSAEAQLSQAQSLGESHAWLIALRCAVCWVLCRLRSADAGESGGTVWDPLGARGGRAVMLLVT